MDELQKINAPWWIMLCYIGIIVIVIVTSLGLCGHELDETLSIVILSLSTVLMIFIYTLKYLNLVDWRDKHERQLERNFKLQAIERSTAEEKLKLTEKVKHLESKNKELENKKYLVDIESFLDLKNKSGLTSEELLELIEKLKK